MDCRKPLVTLGLFCGLAGCNLTNPTPTTSVSQPLPPNQVANVQVRKEVDLPKRTPQAMTCVSAGDFNEEQSRTPGLSDVEVRERRDIARQAYQQALSLDPRCRPAYQGLGRLYVAMKDYDRAAANYTKAQQHFPKDPSLHYELGMCYAQQKAWDPAIQNFDKAAALDPEKRLYNDMLGYTLARAGRYDDSVKVFQRLESEQQAHYNVARMLQHLNEPELAKQHVQAALQKDPEMKDAVALWSELNANPPAAPAPAVQQATFIDTAPH